MHYYSYPNAWNRGSTVRTGLSALYRIRLSLGKRGGLHRREMVIRFSFRSGPPLLCHRYKYFSNHYIYIYIYHFIYTYVGARKIISHEAAGGISGAGMINALERACRIITHLQRPRCTSPLHPPPRPPFPHRITTRKSRSVRRIPDDRLSILRLSLNCPRARAPHPPSPRFCIITHGCAQTRMHA